MVLYVLNSDFKHYSTYKFEQKILLNFCKVSDSILYLLFCAKQANNLLMFNKSEKYLLLVYLSLVEFCCKTYTFYNIS